MTVRRLLVTLATAVGLAACSSPEKPGLHVDVDPAIYGDAVSMTVVVRAVGVGFMKIPDQSIDYVRVTTEDTDGDGLLELLAKFSGPFREHVTFRVEPGNPEALAMHADAMAFNADDMIAAAGGDAELPAGGVGSVALTLGPATGPIGANTRTTDLQTADVDVKIYGHAAASQPNALAVCDIDKDGMRDIVIGAPNDAADGSSLGPTGAVHVIWGGSASGTTIDLATAVLDPNADFLFYGRDGGDRLGTAVACADIDGDGADDLIVGAPGASGAEGRVYVVFGRINFRAVKAVNLLSDTSTGVDVTYTTSTASAALGSALHAADIDGDGHADLLVAALGAKEVHLLPAPAKQSGVEATIDASLADHVVFTGAPIAAIGAGDLDGIAPADVVLGDPTYHTSSDASTRRGAAYVFSNVDVSATTRYDVSAASRTATGATQDALLGTAVLIADTSGGGEDLYLGSPGDGDVGVVYYFAHDSQFFLASTFDLTATETQRITGYEPGSQFGSALAVARAGVDPPVGLRLAVGAPGVSRPNRTGAGAAYFYKADTGRAFRIFEQVFGAAGGDGLGAAVAGGLISAGDTKSDLVVAAPGAAGSAAATGVVYVRFGQ